MLRLKEIDLIRASIIAILVLFHAFAPFGGGWELPEMTQNSTFYHWWDIFLYSGMLETFTFISGYVFAFSLPKKSYTLKQIATGKIKRLYIPCLFWGIVFGLIFFPAEKWLHADSYLSIMNGIAHLWYLPMLFWCFIFEFAIHKYFRNNKFIYPLLFLIAILPYPTLPLHINSSLYYLLFFHTGKIFFENRGRFLQFSKGRILIIFAIYICLFVGGSIARESEQLNPAEASSLLNKAFIIWISSTIRLIYSYLAVILYYSIFLKISVRIKDNAYNKFKFVAIHSFGIYLLQEIFLRIIYYKTPLCQESGFWYPWIGFAIAFVCSLLCSVILSKFRITKYFC